MRVLFFFTSISVKGGGLSRSVPMMAKGLTEVGLDVTLMTLFSDDMNTHAIEGSSVKFIALKQGFNVGEIDTIVTRGKFDIVQLQSSWSLEYHKMAKICRRHGIPYLITPRGMLEPWSLTQSKWKKRLAMMLYQRADLNRASCIYTTAAMEAQHVKQLGVKASCSVIPNGIEMNGYPCRSSVDIVKKQVLFLSRIHVKKGIEILLEAWNILIGNYPGWNLKIVGNGEEGYIESLKNKVKELDLQSSVEIVPPVFGDAKVELYQSSALFVLPSYSENFGMVIAEAMACGVPVITSDNTPWDMLNETKTGWCIPLSVEQLEATLREAMGMDSKDLYEIGQRASEFVRKTYDYRIVGEKTKDLYRWLLESGEKPDSVV